MKENRFSRQEDFFSKEGQKKIRNSVIVIVGVGGVGSHVAQQLTYLGVGTIILIDGDTLDLSNKNRLIGSKHTDPQGELKVNIVKRMINEIDPDIKVLKLKEYVNSEQCFEILKKAHYIFGCIDNDGARLFLNELSLAYGLPYFDIASEILLEDDQYGGRIIFVNDDNPCLMCRDEIDSSEARKYLQNPEVGKDEDAIYGVQKNKLGGSGPAVVSINGIVASIAVTEFMLQITGKRNANSSLTYYGNSGIVRINKSKPDPECYYCNCVKGKMDLANVKRYFAY